MKSYRKLITFLKSKIFPKKNNNATENIFITKDDVTNNGENEVITHAITRKNIKRPRNEWSYIISGDIYSNDYYSRNLLHLIQPKNNPKNSEVYTFIYSFTRNDQSAKVGYVKKWENLRYRLKEFKLTTQINSTKFNDPNIKIAVWIIPKKYAYSLETKLKQQLGAVYLLNEKMITNLTPGGGESEYYNLISNSNQASFKSFVEHIDSLIDKIITTEDFTVFNYK